MEEPRVRELLLPFGALYEVWRAPLPTSATGRGRTTWIARFFCKQSAEAVQSVLDGKDVRGHIIHVCRIEREEQIPPTHTRTHARRARRARAGLQERVRRLVRTGDQAVCPSL